MELCWICDQRQADSHEHKIKASVLKRHYGKKYLGNGMIYDQEPIKTAKFAKILLLSGLHIAAMVHYKSKGRIINWNYKVLGQTKRVYAYHYSPNPGGWAN